MPVYVAPQPVRPGSTRLAKSNASVMLIPLKGGRGRMRFACFGNRSHYRADGGCDHLDVMFPQIKPWYRARTWVLPFGERGRDLVRAASLARAG